MILDWPTNRLFSITAVSFVLALSACASTRMIVPAPTPLNPNRSVVGLSLKGGGAFAPTEVYFIRLDDGQDMASSLLQVSASNYQTHMDRYQRQFYLLNAVPGRYRVIACSKMGGGIWFDSTELTFFLKSSILRTEVVVRPGEVGFMGEYDLLYPTTALLYLNHPDEAQLHYQKQMVSNPPTGFLGNISNFYLSAERHLSAELGYPDPEGGGKFFVTATEDLRKGAWVTLVINRLSDLKARTKNK